MSSEISMLSQKPRLRVKSRGDRKRSGRGDDVISERIRRTVPAPNSATTNWQLDLCVARNLKIIVPISNSMASSTVEPQLQTRRSVRKICSGVHTSAPSLPHLFLLEPSRAHNIINPSHLPRKYYPSLCVAHTAFSEHNPTDCN